MGKRPEVKDINDSTGLIGIGPLPATAPVASFNLDQIESLLQTKGFVAYHYSAAVNPARTSVEAGVSLNTQAAMRGFRYYEAREIRIVPQQFKFSDQLAARGIFDTSSVLLNISGNYYDGDKEVVHMLPHDLIVMNPSITTRSRQASEYNPNGPLKMNFKVKGVKVIFTDDVIFRENIDYEVKDGQIFWMQGGKKPRFNNGKGEVVSVDYWSTPIYIVRDLPHVLRVLPDNSSGHGILPRNARYAPQLVVANMSQLQEEKDILDFSALPPYASYPNSKNTTGGST